MGIGSWRGVFSVLFFAVAFGGLYLLWLIAFERRLEPWLRRGTGALLGCSIVWVRAAGPFRAWGLQRRGVRGDVGDRLDGAVGLLGGATVLCSALLPAIALEAAAKAHAPDVRVTATCYLMTVPLMIVFLLRVLSAGPELR